MMNPYGDEIYYLHDYGGSLIAAKELEGYLEKASRHIDSLTYNRIRGRGFANLTPFQQEVLRRVTCLQADFEYENQDIITSVLASYQIDGVSLTIDAGWNVHLGKGVVMPKDVYALLSQTGLTSRIMEGCYEIS